MKDKVKTNTNNLKTNNKENKTMAKYNSIQSFITDGYNNVIGQAELKDSILRAALHLATNCAHEFEPEIIEEIALPLQYFNEVLDNVG